MIIILKLIKLHVKNKKIIYINITIEYIKNYLYTKEYKRI